MALVLFGKIFSLVKCLEDKAIGAYQLTKIKHGREIKMRFSENQIQEHEVLLNNSFKKANNE